VGALIAVAGLLTMRKIRSNIYNRNEEVLLSDQEREYSEEVINARAIRQERQRISSHTSSEAQNHKFCKLPLDPKSTGSNESSLLHEFEGLNESSDLYKFTGPDEFNELHCFSTQDCTQQVCRCTSATCELCNQNSGRNSVTFIGVEAEEDGMEVDITGNIFQNNHSHGEILRYAGSRRYGSERLHETPDTVQL